MNAHTSSPNCAVFGSQRFEQLTGLRTLRTLIVGLFVVSSGATEPNVAALAATSGDSTATGTAALATTGHTIVLPSYVVSAMRVQKSGWRYAALPGFEVLTRASEDETNWLLDALRRGQWLEDHVLPSDWLSAAPVPYTVIIDDADLKKIRSTQMHAEPIVFSEPPDAFTWGIPTVNVWQIVFKPPIPTPAP